MSTKIFLPKNRKVTFLGQLFLESLNWLQQDLPDKWTLIKHEKPSIFGGKFWVTFLRVVFFWPWNLDLIEYLIYYICHGCRFHMSSFCEKSIFVKSRVLTLKSPRFFKRYHDVLLYKLIKYIFWKRVDFREMKWRILMVFVIYFVWFLGKLSSKKVAKPGGGGGYDFTRNFSW